MPAVEASALEKHRNSSVSATSAALMKRNGRSASAFPQPLQRHETDDIKEEPTMIVHPEPSAIIPDRRIYERRESGVRSYARSMPRQFVRAQGVWMHDSNGGRYLDFLSGCSRSEEHTSELQSLMRISYAVFCLKKQMINNEFTSTHKRK